MGYGSMLTDGTVKKAKELGNEKIILKGHRDKSYAFQIYKKVGFIPVGELPEKNEYKMESQLKNVE